MKKDKCLLSSITAINDHVHTPILADFQNGQIGPEAAKLMECYLGQDASKSNPSIAIAVSENNVYAGRAGGNNSLERTFIAIRNKVTNKMRLIEVNRSSMLSYHYDRIEPDTTVRSISKKEANEQLMRQFGGKQAKRVLERQKRMIVNTDIVKEQLDKAVQSSSNLDKSLDNKDEFMVGQIMRESQLISIVPPRNDLATSLSNVYTLSDIISEDLLERLDEEALQVLQTDLDGLPIKPTVIRNEISRVQNSRSPDSIECLQKLKICIYVDALITYLFELKSKKKLTNRAEFSGISEKVEKDIRSKFIQPNAIQIRRTTFIEHKLVCHIIVLFILLSDDYRTNIADIKELTKVSRIQLGKFVKACSCKVVQEYITLILPSKMVFAPPKTFNKRRAN